METPKLTMLVGFPGSGKSTYAQRKFKADEIFSSDKIREELFGSDNNEVNTPENNTKVFVELHKRIKERLKSGKNAVYDATNISCKRRLAFLRELKNIPCEKQCVIIATPYEDCLINNQQRGRVVPDEVIKRMYMNWNTPYYFEGWDQIKIHYTGKKRIKSVTEWLEENMCFNQKNHHHKLTLGQHCIEVGNKLAELFNDKELAIAGYLHDCGKPFTQTFDENGEAHYYQHHCVGAYDSLFFDTGLSTFGMFDDKKIIRMSALINYHMYPYFWEKDGVNGKKTMEKYKKTWGENFFEDIIRLHRADLNNH